MRGFCYLLACVNERGVMDGAAFKLAEKDALILLRPRKAA